MCDKFPCEAEVNRRYRLLNDLSYAVGRFCAGRIGLAIPVAEDKVVASTIAGPRITYMLADFTFEDPFAIFRNKREGGVDMVNAVGSYICPFAVEQTEYSRIELIVNRILPIIQKA